MSRRLQSCLQESLLPRWLVTATFGISLYLFFFDHLCHKKINLSAKQVVPQPWRGEVVSSTSSMEKMEALFSAIYLRNIRLLKSGKKPKLCLYRYGDGSGFGNRMRATSYVFLLSLYTERLFLVDHGDHQIHFSSPGNSMNIFWSNFDAISTFQNLSRQVISVPQAHYKDFCGMLPDLDHSVDIFEHVHGNDPKGCFLSNTSQKEWAMAIFGTTNDREITGRIMSFLLKNPQPNLLMYVSELKRQMGWGQNQLNICVQFRAFIDLGLENMKLFPEFCWQASNLIQRTFQTATLHQSGLLEPAVWVTSDYPDVPKLFQKCSGLKNITFMRSPFKVEHTSEMQDGLIKAPIAEWYLMGEANSVISTGTSFAEYAMARTNYSSNFYIWDASASTFTPYLPTHDQFIQP